MADAIFRQGNPVRVDYTPSADVAAGDIVALGDLLHIAHVDIPDGELGSLAARNGLYDVVKDSSTFTAGATVYWTGTAATSTASTNDILGYAALAAATGDGVVRVVHTPAAGASE